MTRDQWLFAGLMFLQTSLAAAAVTDAFPAKVAAVCGVFAAGLTGMLTVVKGNAK